MYIYIYPYSSNHLHLRGFDGGWCRSTGGFNNLRFAPGALGLGDGRSLFFGPLASLDRTEGPSTLRTMVNTGSVGFVRNVTDRIHVYVLVHSLKVHHLKGKMHTSIINRYVLDVPLLLVLFCIQLSVK